MKQLYWIRKMIVHRTSMKSVSCQSEHHAQQQQSIRIRNNKSYVYFRIAVEESSIKWLAEICDGDARIALNSLQLAIESLQDTDDSEEPFRLKVMPLDSIKDGIKVGRKSNFHEH